MAQGIEAKPRVGRGRRDAAPSVTSRVAPELDVARRRRRDARGRRLPPPSADGMAAARGRDAGAVRRPRLASPGVVEHVTRDRGGAPLHFLLAWAVAHLGFGLGGLRLVSAAFALASLPLVARARPPAGRPVGRAGRGRARRAELAVPLPRRLRPDVQPVPLPLARLHACPPRARSSAAAGGAGRCGSRASCSWWPHTRTASCCSAAQASSCSLAARDRIREAIARGRGGARARHPVLAHRPRARGPVRRRRRRRRREARRPGGGRAVPLAVGRRLRPPAGGRSRSPSCSRCGRRDRASCGATAARSSLCLVGVTGGGVPRREARRLGGTRVAAPDLPRCRSSRSPSRRPSCASRGGCPAVARRRRRRRSSSSRSRGPGTGHRRSSSGSRTPGRRRARRRRPGSPRRAGPTTSCSATSRSTSAPGSGTARFPDDGRAARRRQCSRFGRSSGAAAARPRRLGPRRERAEQPPAAPRDRATASPTPRRRSRRASSGRSSSCARASRWDAGGLPLAARRARCSSGGRSGSATPTSTCETVVLADARAAGLRPVAALPLEQLAVAGRALERGEARLDGSPPPVAAHDGAPAATADAPIRPPRTNDRMRPRRRRVVVRARLRRP